MAVKLEDKQNVQAPDGDYPYGQIKDDTGAGDGTPVDVAVYGDFHQFFARMFALSGLTYNGLPDNDYSGFQYIEAANKLWKSYTGVKVINSDTFLDVNDLNKLVVVIGNVANVDVFLPNTNASQEGDSFTIMNYSAYTVNVRRKVPDGIYYEGSSVIILSLPTIGDYSTFVADVANTDWYAINYRIKPTAKISQQITLASQSTASPSYVDMTGLTYTNTSGVSKKFKLTVKGDAEIGAVSGTTAGAGGKVKITDGAGTTDYDISRLELTVIVTSGTTDVVGCLPINCQTIVTLAAGDVVKCQFLNDADGITVKEVKFLIEELES